MKAAWSIVCCLALPLRLMAQELPASSACHAALQALATAEDALAAQAPAAAASSGVEDRLRAVSARLFPWRQRVADACLGGLPTSPSPRLGNAATVPPGPRAGPPAGRPPALPAPPLTAPRIEPPVTVNHCDATTCVASDGSTLTRVGPSLVGPRGACTLQGIFLRCP